MIYLVYGPPGSGKTTYVKNHMSAGDIIIDFDLLSRALAGTDDHDRENILFDRINDCRNYLVNTINRYPEVRHTWVILCAPKKEDRELFVKMGATLKLIEEPASVCIARCRDRGENWQRWEKAIKKWFEDYEVEVL